MRARALEAQRQSAAVIAKATSNDGGECKDPHVTPPPRDLTPEEIKQIQGVWFPKGYSLPVA